MIHFPFIPCLGSRSSRPQIQIRHNLATATMTISQMLLSSSLANLQTASSGLTASAAPHRSTLLLFLATQRSTFKTATFTLSMPKMPTKWVTLFSTISHVITPIATIPWLTSAINAHHLAKHAHLLNFATTAGQVITSSMTSAAETANTTK